jgi:FdrA protein
VLLLDVVLGYGAHPDPSREIVPVLRAARAAAAGAGRGLGLVGFVCGTQGDPQGLARQEAALREAGMVLTGSNAQAARLAAQMVSAHQVSAHGTAGRA